MQIMSAIQMMLVEVDLDDVNDNCDVHDADADDSGDVKDGGDAAWMK